MPTSFWFFSLIIFVSEPQCFLFVLDHTGVVWGGLQLWDWGLASSFAHLYKHHRERKWVVLFCDSWWFNFLLPPPLGFDLNLTDWAETDWWRSGESWVHQRWMLSRLTSSLNWICLINMNLNYCWCYQNDTIEYMWKYLNIVLVKNVYNLTVKLLKYLVKYWLTC